MTALFILKMISCPLRFYFVLLIAEYVAGATDMIQLVGVHVPALRTSNSDVLLKCRFKIHPPATLYSVKWYKDDAEFYRYLPGDSPPAQAFPLPGVSVKMSQSNERQVMLENLQLSSTGVYLCEVSTEAPSFHTVSGQGLLSVIASAPVGGPHIWGLRGLYVEGDLVDVNCTSTPSKPVARIVWHVNGEEPLEGELLDYGVRMDRDSDLAVAVKGLRLHATHETFPNRILKLKCVAHLGPQEWELQRWTFLMHRHHKKSGTAGHSQATMTRNTEILFLPFAVVLYISVK